MVERAFAEGAVYQTLGQQGGTGEDSHIHLADWTLSVAAIENKKLKEDGASNSVGLMCTSFGHSLYLKMGVFFRTMCAASNVYHSVVWTAVTQQGGRLTIASFTPCWSTSHQGDVTGMRKHDHLSLTTRSGGLFVFYAVIGFLDPTLHLSQFNTGLVSVPHSICPAST